MHKVHSKAKQGVVQGVGQQPKQILRDKGSMSGINMQARHCKQLLTVE